MQKWLRELAGVCSVMLFGYGTAAIAATGGPALMTGPGLLGLSLLGGFAAAVMMCTTGKISKAHIAPLITISRLATGSILPAEAGIRLLAQAAGLLLGVAILWLLQRATPGFTIDPQIWEAVIHGNIYTGSYKPVLAFAGEVMLSFLSILALLAVRAMSRQVTLAGLAITGQLLLIALLPVVAGWDEDEHPCYILLASQHWGSAGRQLGILVTAVITGAGAAVLLKPR